MANKVDSSKLLPSSKSSAIVPYQKPSIALKNKKTILSSSIKPIKLERKSSAIVKQSTEENLNDIGGKLVKIEKILGSELLLSRRKKEVRRKEDEQKDFQKAEEKLETKKPKGNKFPKFPELPTLSLPERLKRFIFFTALGRFLPAILEFLPKLEGVLKTIGTVYSFAENLFGKLLDGFTTLVKFGGDLKDKTLGFIAELKTGPGGDYQKEFNNLEKQFNLFANASIVAGLLGAEIGFAAVDEFKKRTGRKPEEKPKPGGKPPVPRGKVEVTQGRGGQKPKGKPRVTQGRGGKPKPWWQRITGGIQEKFGKFTGKLAKPFSKFASTAIPGFGAAVGYLDAKARAESGDKLGSFLAGLGAGLDAFTFAVGAAGLGAAATGVALPGAAVLGAVAAVTGTISTAIDVVLLIRDLLRMAKVPDKLLGFSKGGRVVRKYQGGGTNTRGGKPVRTSSRRTYKPSRKRPIKITPPKSQPGKDVGGKDKIQRLYPDNSPRYFSNWKDWASSTDAMGDRRAGSFKMHQELFKKSKEPNPYKALTSTAKILKEIPLVGGLMGAAVDVALGQRPDKRIYQSISSGISYLVEGLANQRVDKSMSSLMYQIRGFADGGTVPTRELRNTGSSMNNSDVLAKVLETTIGQKVNEAIQSIEKELRLKGKKDEEGSDESRPGAGPDGSEGGIPGARLRGGSNAKIESDLLEYFTALYGKNAAVGIVANLRRESGYRTNTPDNPRFQGMAQWDRNHRWPALVKWAESKGLDPFNRNTQAQYIAVELKQMGTDQRLKQAKTAEEAASIFYNEFERAAYSRPVVGSKNYNPDNPHERKNKGFIRDIMGSNPNIGERGSEVVVSPTNTESRVLVSGGIVPSRAIITSTWQSFESFRRAPHTGIDYGYPVGTPISLIKEGEVVEASTGYNAGYGNFILVKHKDGTYSMFNHLDKIYVRRGQMISASSGNATVIGTIGDTGFSTGPHLDYKVATKWDGYRPSGFVDPRKYQDSVFRIGGNVRIKPSEVAKLGMKNGKEGVIENGKWRPKVWTPEERERYNQVIGNTSQSQSPPGQSGQSGLTLQQAIDLQRRSDNLKPGDKPIVVTGVGSIQMGRNWRGQPVKKYFNPGGTEELEPEEFNRRMQRILPQGSQIDWNRRGNRPSRGSSVQAVPGTTYRFQGWTYFKGKDGKYYGTIAGKTTEISKEDWNTIIPRSQKVQGKKEGGLISPSKPNRAIPDSFAPYETPGGEMTFVFQPMIYYKYTQSLEKIDFPIMASTIVNSIQASSFNRG